MNLAFKDKLNSSVLISILIFSVFSYLPTIVKTENYYLFSKILGLLTIFLFISNFKFELFKIGIIRLIIFVEFYYLVYTAIFFGKIDWNMLYSLLLVFMFVSIGYSLNVTLKLFNRIVISYGLLTILLGVISVFYFIGKFEIIDIYKIPIKNSSGVILAFGLFSLLFKSFIIPSKSRIVKFLYWISMLVIFVCLLTFRTRSALVAVILVILLFILIHGKLKYISYILLFIAIVFIFNIIIFKEFAPKFQQKYFIESFTAKRKISNLNEFSSGRIEDYEKAINVINQDPLFGNTFLKDKSVPWTHNYVLSIVFQYGLLGGFPLLLLYFYLFTMVVKRIFERNNIISFAYYLLFIAFIVSIFEPTYPYNPGTVTFICFLSLGISLQLKEEQYSQVNNFFK